MAYFTDRATLRNGKARITPEGYFVADALVARANNVQEYRAGEIGLTDRAADAIVRVFRPESEVFAIDSLRSASRLPITLDHPPGVMVDASNWREYAKGETGEEVMRDGEFIRVPIRVTDATAVESVQRDRLEFSMGYTAEIIADAGEFNGQAYDARVTNLRYNHLAACRAARGGPELCITDERPASGVPPMTKIVVIDNLPVDVANPDTAETTIRNLIAARDTAVDGLAAATETIAARDAEIVTLKDAAKPVTPAQLRDAAREYDAARKAAETMGVTVTDEMDVPAMHRAAVTARMGDAAKAYTPEQYAAAFGALAAANVTDANAAPDPLRAAIADGAATSNVTDATAAFADARAKRLERLQNGHRTAATA